MTCQAFNIFNFLKRSSWNFDPVTMKWPQGWSTFASQITSFQLWKRSLNGLVNGTDLQKNCTDTAVARAGYWADQNTKDKCPCLKMKQSKTHDWSTWHTHLPQLWLGLVAIICPFEVCFIEDADSKCLLMAENTLSGGNTPTPPITVHYANPHQDRLKLPF